MHILSVSCVASIIELATTVPYVLCSLWYVHVRWMDTLANVTGGVRCG